MDSGAVNKVMPRRMVRDPSKIRPSSSSKRGVHYVTANDGRIANEGDVDFRSGIKEGHNEQMVYFNLPH